MGIKWDNGHKRLSRGPAIVSISPGPSLLSWVLFRPASSGTAFLSVSHSLYFFSVSCTGSYPSAFFKTQFIPIFKNDNEIKNFPWAHMPLHLSFYFILYLTFFNSGPLSLSSLPPFFSWIHPSLLQASLTKITKIFLWLQDPTDSLESFLPWLLLGF